MNKPIERVKAQRIVKSIGLTTQKKKIVEPEVAFKTF